MNILITLFVTIILATLGAVAICCFIMPMLGIVAVLANGVDGYKLDKITDKYSLSGKKSALALMTKTMTVMALGASCIAFMFYKINPSEQFMLFLAIAEFALAPLHIYIGTNLKYQINE